MEMNNLGTHKSEEGSVGRGMSQADRDATLLTRMGKKPVLKRKFGFLSMLSFSCTILATWEGVLFLFTTSYRNGGPAGMVYQFILVWGGTLSTFCCISELASMAPTAGGQYHWVSMLAPKSMRNFASYITGWITVIAWLASVASGAILSSGMIQAICLLNFPSYAETAAPYQITLIAWSILLLCIFFNAIIGEVLPKTEAVFLVLHILGFFGIIIPLIYNAEKGNASEIFSTFLNEGGWPTYGLSFMVGTLSAALSFVGADAAVHMCEEIVNPAVNIPRAIIISIFVNGSLGFGMLMTALFCMGDPKSLLESEASVGFPYIHVFLQATGSKGGTSAMSAILITLASSASVGFLATASRMIWSFARDRGLPFSQYLSRVNQRTRIPTSAIVLASIIPALLAVISIGSSVAFSDVTSLAVNGFVSTYLIATSMLLYRRLGSSIRKPVGSQLSPAAYDSETDEYILTWGPWHIPGWFGIANNVLSIVYLGTIWIFAFFPSETPVTPETMNFSSLVFGGAVLYSIIYYLIWGKKQYAGPIVEIAT